MRFVLAIPVRVMRPVCPLTLRAAALPVVDWFNVGKVLPAPVRSLLVKAWLSEIPTIVPEGAVSDVPQVLDPE